MNNWIKLRETALNKKQAFRCIETQQKSYGNRSKIWEITEFND